MIFDGLSRVEFAQSFPIYIYLLILILDKFQLISYLLETNRKEYWDYNVLEVARQFLNMIILNYTFFKKSRLNMIITAYFCSSIIWLANISLIAIFTISARKVNINGENYIWFKIPFKYFLIFFSLYIQSFVYYLFSLFLLPLLRIIICSDNYWETQIEGEGCYQGTGFWIIFTISLSSLIMLFIQLSIFLICTNDFNPFSKNFLAGDCFLLNFITLVSKLICIGFKMIDPNDRAHIWLHMTIFLIYALMIILKITKITFFEMTVNIIDFMFDVAINWICLSTLLYNLLRSSGGGHGSMILLIIGYVILVAVLTKCKQNYLKSLCTKKLSGMKSSSNASNMILYLIWLVKRRSNQETEQDLTGIIRNMIIKNSSFLDNSEDLIDMISTDINLFEREEEDERIDLTYYKIIQQIAQNITRNIKDNQFLLFIIGCIEKEKMRNHYNSVFCLQIVEDKSISIIMLYETFKLKMQIQSELVKNDMLCSLKNGLNVSSIVKFQADFNRMKEKSKLCSEIYLEFWQIIKQRKYDFDELFSKGKQISIYQQSIHKLYKSLSEDSPNNPKLINVYSSILELVFNDVDKAKQIRENYQKNSLSQDFNLNETEDMRVKFGENTDSVVIRASGNPDNIGQILGCSDEIGKLGFNQKDVVGKMVEMFLPKVIHEIHVATIKRYFERGSGKLMNSQQQLFVLDKNGFIKPFNAFLRIMPNLEDGIQIIMFLRAIRNGLAQLKGAKSQNSTAIVRSDRDIKPKSQMSRKYIIFGEDLNIYAVSRSVAESYGINKFFCYDKSKNKENNLSMLQILPNIKQDQFIQTLLSQQSINADLDTYSLKSKIIENFLINEEEILMKNKIYNDKQQFLGSNDQISEKYLSRRSEDFDEGYVDLDIQKERNIDILLNQRRFKIRKIQLSFVQENTFLDGKFKWYVVEIQKQGFNLNKEIVAGITQKLPTIQMNKNKIIAQNLSNFQKKLMRKNSQQTGAYSTHSSTKKLIEVITREIKMSNNHKQVKRFGICFFFSILGLVIVKAYELYHAALIGPGTYNYLAEYQGAPQNLEAIISQAMISFRQIEAIVSDMYKNLDGSNLTETQKIQRGNQIQNSLKELYQDGISTRNQLSQVEALMQINGWYDDDKRYDFTYFLPDKTKNIIPTSHLLGLNYFLENIFIVYASNINELQEESKLNRYQSLFFNIWNGKAVFKQDLPKRTKIINRYLNSEAQNMMIVTYVLSIFFSIVFACIMIPYLNSYNLIFLKIISFMYLVEKHQLIDLNKGIQNYMNKFRKNNFENKKFDTKDEEFNLIKSIVGAFNDEFKQKIFSNLENSKQKHNQILKQEQKEEKQKDEEIDKDLHDFQEQQIKQSTQEINFDDGEEEYDEYSIGSQIRDNNEQNKPVNNHSHKVPIAEEIETPLKGEIYEVNKSIIINQDSINGLDQDKTNANLLRKLSQSAIDSKLEEEENEDEYSLDYIRSRLAKNYSQSKHILVICCIMVFMITILTAQFIYEILTKKNILQIENYGNNIYDRNKYPNYALFNVYDSIINKKKSNSFILQCLGEDYSIYLDEIYSSNDKIQQIILNKKKFSDSFDEYFNFYNQVDENICSQNQIYIDNCEGQEFLVKGIKLSTIRIAENYRDIGQQIDRGEDFYQIIKSNELIQMENLQINTGKIYKHLSSLFKASFINYIKRFNYYLVFSILLTIFGLIILIIIFWLIIIKKIIEKVIYVKYIIQLLPLQSIFSSKGKFDQSKFNEEERVEKVINGEYQDKRIEELQKLFNSLQQLINLINLKHNIFKTLTCLLNHLFELCYVLPFSCQSIFQLFIRKISLLFVSISNLLLYLDPKLWILYCFYNFSIFPVNYSAIRFQDKSFQ